MNPYFTGYSVGGPNSYRLWPSKKIVDEKIAKNPGSMWRDNAPLSLDICGYHREYVILNETQNDIFVTDFTGYRYVIKSVPRIHGGNAWGVRIRSRVVVGARRKTHMSTIADADGLGSEDFIPIEEMMKGPVVNLSVAAIFSLTERVIDLDEYPFTEAGLKQVRFRLVDEILRENPTPIVQFHGNDSSNQYRDVYVVVDGRIHKVGLTNHPSLSGADSFHVSIRNENGNGYTSHHVDMNELRQKKLAVVGGTMVSLNLDLLRTQLAATTGMPVGTPAHDTLTIEQHTALMMQAKAAAMGQVDAHEKVLKEKDAVISDNATVIKQLNDRIKQQANIIENYTRDEELHVKEKQRLKEEELRLQAMEMEFKKAKLAEEQRKSEEAEKASRGKWKRDLLEFAGTLAKVAAVIIPAAFGIFKLFNKGA